MTTTKQKETTSANEWRKATGTKLNLPSGHVCLVQRPGVRAFFNSGIIPDELTPMVQAMIQGKVDLAEDEKAKVFEQADNLVLLLKMVDDIMVHCVQAPRLLAVPQRQIDEERTEDVPMDERPDPGDALWVDEIDDEDKQFVFQFAVGGTKDLKTFREQARQSVDRLQPRDSDGDTTE